MAARIPLLHITAAEYLESEKTSPVRHEYLAGQVYAMSGASAAHNTISLNLASRLRAHLRGGPCRVFMSDMKLRVEGTDSFYYPDVLVTCDPEDRGEYFKTSPLVIVEVSSPSTTLTDHREKLLAYQKIPSLREYILVAQDEMKVEVYRHDPRGWWWIEMLEPEHELEFQSLKMTMAEVYEDVEF